MQLTERMPKEVAKPKLEQVLNQISSFLQYRLKELSKEEVAYPAQVNFDDKGLLEGVFPDTSFSEEEKVVFYLALLPHWHSALLDEIISANIKKAGDFPQLGGCRGKDFRGFIPTGQTALYLLAGNDFSANAAVRDFFSADHFFAEKRVLWLGKVPPGEPQMSGKIVINPDVLERILSGREPKPHFSMEFPAERLETKMTWDDLVLNPRTWEQIRELEIWLEHGDTLLQSWGMDKFIKPGYRALFHGPPGTGKTLTASLLGKHTGRDVYRVDLSMVISKYIGETEKNLANLFARAENKNWILFFDEADALFGKRTNVKDAHDRFANQEVSYLLQRVEAYNGLVILASNFKSNIDEAFMRRFQNIIHFGLPTSSERLKLWTSTWPQKIKFAQDVDLAQIARSYEVTGANIVNVVQKVCLRLLDQKKKLVTQKDLLQGLRWEMAKEGKRI